MLEESKNPAVREAVVRAQQSGRRGDIAGVIANLQEAEKHATGREKSALQLELAQHFRDSKRHKEAAAYFRRVAEGADEETLRHHALKRVDAMLKRAEQNPQGEK
jgi:predicted negative regulator of RcsB-dependent stress response